MEKDWLAFGHPFSDRVGMPTLSGSGGVPFELSRHYSTGSLTSCQSSSSFSSQAQSASHGQNNYSPIFLQVLALMLRLLFSNAVESSFIIILYHSPTCILVPALVVRYYLVRE